MEIPHLQYIITHVGMIYPKNLYCDVDLCYVPFCPVPFGLFWAKGDKKGRETPRCIIDYSGRNLLIIQKTLNYNLE